MSTVEDRSRKLFSKWERERVLSKTKGKCSHCGKALTEPDMTVDHIFPKSKGGLDDEYNLLPLCFDCNENKSNYVYYLDDYYKHIDPAEYTRFDMYNNYATFDYVRGSILGYDEVVLSFLPYKSIPIIEQMEKRRAKRQKIEAMTRNLSVKAILRRAWPADADRLFAIMEKNIETCISDVPHIYTSGTSLLNAITNGEAYMLERGDELCGAFIFEPADMMLRSGVPIQLENILEHTGMKIKYVMTHASVNTFACPAYDKIMKKLERSQQYNGWMPLYFGILEHVYKHKDKCFLVPSVVNGMSGNLEFMQYKEMVRTLNETFGDIFGEHGYKVDEYDLKLFSEYLLSKHYQSEFEGDAEAEEFFRKYPHMKDYFKPDSYEWYGTGFIR